MALDSFSWSIIMMMAMQSSSSGASRPWLWTSSHYLKTTKINLIKSYAFVVLKLTSCHVINSRVQWILMPENLEFWASKGWYPSVDWIIEHNESEKVLLIYLLIYGSFLRLLKKFSHSARAVIRSSLPSRVMKKRASGKPQNYAKMLYIFGKRE